MLFPRPSPDAGGKVHAAVVVGQPLLAVRRSLSRAKADSQEWLSYKV